MSWRIVLKFLRKSCGGKGGCKSSCELCGGFWVCVGEAAEVGSRDFFLGENKLEWIMSSHNARWSPGESEKDE